MNIKVIDNFLEEEDFKELNSIKLKDIKKNEIFIHHNRISGEKIIENTCLNKKLLTRLNKNYHKKYNQTEFGCIFLNSPIFSFLNFSQ